ncbi:MAG: hypothetical protein IIA54_05255 [Chloroflexi bacterium]|nr:hypothetical protein [Chloroflexota bacterium]
MQNQPPTVLRGRVLLLLAVFVTVALVGMATNALRRGEDNLGASELRQIQAAVLTLMTHNGITTIPNPVREPTSDLRRFPDVSTPPSRKGMLEGDLPGYVLYEHDLTADGLPEATVSYVRFATGRWAYTADRDGTVTQWERATTD